MTHKITVEGTDIVAECDEDEPIAECLEMHDIYIECDCRVGVCGTCEIKLTHGTVNQDNQSVLDEDQLASGSILSCIACPQSDCTVKIDT